MTTDGVQISSETAAPHPEEMKAAVDLQIGRYVSFKATVRLTPAGIGTTAVLVLAVMVPLVWMVKFRARGRSADY